ncbi:hypothetical protein [Planctobacterium marinum]|uniref:Uncharacterized protein n=1 Tax=Planctobacterium marinum TaxID=1631968 RepID=A0AA48HMY2_9ALTE|nr:hypothetical protein MACH26_09630 [Planctobacterium marinum]
MADFDLFSVMSLSLPDSWQKDEPELVPDAALNMGANVPEITLFNSENEAGNLAIKCYQFETKGPEQQVQLLKSVYAETEQEEVAPSVYCGLEELKGEEEGEDIAVTRWLIAITKSDKQFTLLTFSHSVSVTDLDSDASNQDITAIENAIKQAKWR